MLIFVTTIHVLVCVFMIFVILLQPGKDAGMGSALGGGAATSAFGGRGAVTFLSKLTGVCAGLFFFTSLGLSFVGLRSSVVAGGSVAAPPPAAQAPATPGSAAPAEQSAPASTPADGQQAAPGSVEQPRGEAPAAPAEGQSAPAPTPAP
ncbi:preprotein translocase subunit SecG [Myxococcus stipitatus]|uniref:preprotein translocase subunit SecG n=1 Tax=Myxococcus stipitatus TaxID=83455 RepID=UPI001F2B346F|nr:preprotein translocase subunit SecG [Myxococcus stipitatus]MCE9667044.1 preprotein translocase subunit SecG [Myxococcus stipitatus]